MRPRVIVADLALVLLLGPTSFIALPATQTDPAPLRTFHINNQVACLDGAGGGTEARPFCTLNHVSTWWRPGDLFLLHSRRDGSGPVEFTRSGTTTAPITVRGVGTPRPIIGSFVDLKDEDFVATSTPGVFRLTGAPSGVVWQTYFPDILVDDPNASKYTMTATDGPLQLVTAPTDTVLAQVEGTVRFTPEGLLVHPFGSQPPSVTTSDLVMGRGRALNFSTSVTGLIFEHLMSTYSGTVYTMQINGTANRFRDMAWVGVPLTLRGTGHTVERYIVSHVHIRDATSKWTWHYAGMGTTVDVNGSGHRLLQGEVKHSWNAEISTEDATNITIDGVRAHGAPNHCGVGNGVKTGYLHIANATAFNCQDYIWIRDGAQTRFEHVTVAGGGFGVEAVTKALGPLTIRNTIAKGDILWIRGLPERCTWEAGSIIEQNVFQMGAVVERCADLKPYTHQDYTARCASGEFQNCAVFRNNRYVAASEWGTVLKDGMWNGTTFADPDQWDVTLVPGSPALNIGATSVLTDILRVPRPQPAGGLSDAGIYEVSDLPAPAAQSAPTVKK